MRLIDADNLYAVLDHIAARLFETKSEPQCSMAQTIQTVMGIVMDQPTTTLPTDPLPNDPLTLEALRKMDGEPVWISSKGINRYDICCKVTTDNMVQFYTVALPGLGYGKTWKAYRRRPEEERK